MWSLLCPISFLLAAPTVLAQIICNQMAYGHPAYGDCLQALASISYSDQYPRFFIENPLLAKPLSANWEAFKDPRPPTLRTQPIQLPKVWSYGKIHVPI